MKVRIYYIFVVNRSLNLIQMMIKHFYLMSIMKTIKSSMIRVPRAILLDQDRRRRRPLNEQHLVEEVEEERKLPTHCPKQYPL